MKVYCAGPLFSAADREFLDRCARRLRDSRIDCFLPHEAEASVASVSAEGVFALDYEELSTSHALLAWLDGPTVDDGSACEIGIFYGLMRQNAPWRKGIVGLVTDLRMHRRRHAVEHGGLNLFLAAAIQRAGRICWSLEEALDQLLAWKRELDEPAG